MTGSELILLAFILLFFGGLSGIFTFVSLRLMWQYLENREFFIEVGTAEKAGYQHPLF